MASDTATAALVYRIDTSIKEFKAGIIKRAEKL